MQGRGGKFSKNTCWNFQRSTAKNGGLRGGGIKKDLEVEIKKLEKGSRDKVELDKLQETKDQLGVLIQNTREDNRLSSMITNKINNKTTTKEMFDLERKLRNVSNKLIVNMKSHEDQGKLMTNI